MDKEPECLPTDADIALGMAMRNEDALRLFLERYGGRLQAFLQKRFGAVLQSAELDASFNEALSRVWRFAERYDERKGTLGGWAVRIAQRAAQGILRCEAHHRTKERELDPDYDPADPLTEDNGDGDAGFSDQQLADLDKAITQLPRLQQAIIRADLAADGPADAERLATLHGTSKNSIYVSRSKAIQALKDAMSKMGHPVDNARMRR